MAFLSFMFLTFRQRNTSSSGTGYYIRALLSFMFLIFRQRKTSSSGTGCCTSIAQFHASHLQAKEDEQQRNWMLHEHCSVSCVSPAGKGRRAAAELDAARALLSFMLLTCRQRKTSSSGTRCCTSMAQFHGSHLQAKEDEQQWN